ncbi:MAG TPA: TraM recognition domain-containing protein, partial [Candidatus Paceibacterota bacterium]|nr:TraM recognition domain-containing protein [Candidatus Paceibacterota bacterium]
FTSNPLIRNIIGQPKSSIDFRQIMDEKKILIVNLSKGRLGEDNAKLIGAMLITKIYLAAMSRANATEREMKALPPFYLFVDEFQSFVNDSFADILSEARKYKLALTVAHQYIEQMPENVRNAVFGNVGTTISFRVGPFDAEVLEKVFTPTFTQEDLVNLGFAQIYLTLMINGVGSPPFSASTLPRIVSLEESHKEEIIANSQKAFGMPRAQVEQLIKGWMDENKPTVQPGKDNHKDWQQGAPKKPQQPPAANPPAAQSKPPFADRRKESIAVPVERRRPPQHGPRPDDRKSEEAIPRAVPAPSVPEQKPVSLGMLKNNVKDSGKHKDALRSALQSLLSHQAPVAEPEKKEMPGKSVEPMPKAPEPPVSKTPDAPPAEKAQPVPPVAQNQAPKVKEKGEIPEDVLREMLEVKPREQN